MAMNNRLMRPKATIAAAPPAAPALYFSASDEYDSAWVLANWFQNAACTIPATALPTAADDVVFLTNAYNGDAPSIFQCRNLTATGVLLYNFYEKKLLAAGVVTLNNSSVADSYIEAASIVATNNSSGEGFDYEVRMVADSITLTDFTDAGGCVFVSPDVQLFGSGSFFAINGNATFNDTTANSGSVTGNATFNDASNNFGTVGGTITCNTTGVCSVAVAPSLWKSEALRPSYHWST
jgi:hypothetical protein